MSYKAIYAYPWDIAEIGVSAAVDRFLALGLDTVTITGSYHAGKFLRPHGKGGKVYFPEDGTIYFKPDLSRYGAIKPVENSLVGSSQDIVRELVGQSRMATMSPSNALSITLRVSAGASPSSSSSIARVALLRWPLGRPLGLPLVPGSNGRPRPLLMSARSVSWLSLTARR